MAINQIKDLGAASLDLGLQRDSCPNCKPRLAVRKVAAADSFAQAMKGYPPRYLDQLY
jgi:hypothetical protein